MCWVTTTSNVCAVMLESLQARMALVGADAAKAALARMDAELALPPGYTPSLHGGTSSNKQDSTGHATSTGGINSHASSGGTRSGNKPQQDESAVEGLQRLVANVSCVVITTDV
jgi:hypothetical protein